MNLVDALAAVRQFHRHIAAPAASTHCLLPHSKTNAALLVQELQQFARKLARMSGKTDMLVSRLAMAIEELAEWVDAHNRSDLVAAADAFADRLVVLLGDAVACGLPAGPLFNEVMASNMTKQRAGESGKAVKGAGYQPPDIKKVLEDHHG